MISGSNDLHTRFPSFTIPIIISISISFNIIIDLSTLDKSALFLRPV